MALRIALSLAPLLLALAAICAAGFALAWRERAAFVARHVVEPTATRTIDLRPGRYADLPPPVRRYFDYAFHGRQQVDVHWVEWRETGRFLLPVGRFRVRGRQASRADAPVYAWSGHFLKGPLPVLESRDALSPAGHDMRAKLFGWIRVMRTDYDDPAELASLQSYLVLRYYGQAPLMPWALLPNRHVAWAARDASSAWLEITREGLAGRYLVTFAEDGAIRSMETDRLLMEGNRTMQREVGLKLDYGEVGGFRVPTRMDYRWYLADGSLNSRYAFEVTDLEIRR